MKLTKQEQDIVRRKFSKYCIEVLNGEALNYLEELDRLWEQEINFSDLGESILNQFCSYDEIPESDYFQIMGMEVPVRDEAISNALYRLPEGQMSISVFLMFVLFSFVLFGSVENINDAAHTLGVIDSAMNKLEALENVNYIDQDGTDIKPATYDIEFRDVSFGYDSRIVLHDLNFKIPQNSTTAIVGPSGSGKSTLCNLIARFYDVNSGTITVGGTDIRRFTCDSLLKNISMVFQNVYLFRDTIKNNIKFGSPDATDEQIIAAAKAARCHDFIMALPDGYDTVIGEGGSSLSGGEKQRISIARAMLKDAPIVILDEATASIDPENEHLIQEAISALTHGKTIITIAHRLATIENADQILVIDGGTVAQRGTHKELLQQEGTYKKFIQIREQAEGWRIQ